MPRFFARALNRKPSVSSLLASEIKVRRFIALRKFVRSVMRHMLIANLILMAGIATQSPTHRYWNEKGHQPVTQVIQWRPRPSPEGAALNNNQSGR